MRRRVFLRDTKRRKPFGVMLIIVVLALVAAACEPAAVDEDVDETTTTAPAPPPDPVVGDPLPSITIFTTTEAYDPIRFEAGFMIAEAWEELGFTVEVLPMEFGSILEAFYDEQNFDATILGWSGRVDRLDPQHFLGTLYGGHTDLGGNNPGGWVNAEYDELYEAQAREFDVDERRALVLRMQEIAADEIPVNVLFYRDEVVAYNHDTFENFVAMAGEAIYNEWTPYSVTPVGDDRILTIGTPQEPDSINPLASTSVWGWKFMRMYYDKLVRLNVDIEPEPWAAESINPVDDVTLDVVLREGMTFHDGEPVTVNDIKFTFDYYIESQFGYFSPALAPIDSVEVVDDRTVRFHLVEPNAPFIIVTLSQIPILPMHIWQDIAPGAELAPDEIPTVGSGPFRFERFDRGEFKALTVFEDHWTAGDIDLDGVEWIIYADQEGVLTGLQTGEIDMTAWRLEPGGIPIAEAEDHVTVIRVPDFGYFHLTFNTLRSPLDDPAVRRALSHAVDHAAIIDVLLDGLGEAGNSVVAPINAFWHNPDATFYEYDLDRARQILEDAGYGWDDQGRIVGPAG